MSMVISGTGGITFPNGSTQAESPASLGYQTAAQVTSTVNSLAIGINQTWQSVTRTSGVTYFNTTGKPIQVQSICTVAIGAGTTSATVNGVALGVIGGGYNQSGTQAFANATLIIPPGASYVLTDGGAAFSSRTTNELR